ncbi:type-F conjugative transfer system protein TrbI [Vibrio crassostreae]|uniref:type-F conjugative transfer system protein TrbI n=1 Tax=Vibrio crassostreae TaxID=246167 RepID=UPI001B310113|nr:type-F conjugative transfer system protein TrbI [Vibrio crassostreae]
MIRLFPLVALTLSISILVSLSTFFILSTTHTQTLVSFDVKSTIDAYHQSLIQKEISLEAQTQRLSQFVEIMNDEVGQYQQENNAVVLISAAVVDGTIDITPHIQQAIIDRYKDKEVSQ